MKNQIKLAEKQVEYTLKKSYKARKMRLTIDCSGNFTVTAPRFMSLQSVERLIIGKSDWILKKLDYFKTFNKGVIRSKDDFKKNKLPAFALANERINYFNEFYKFEFKKITIKNQKTRWGSCSRNGNINFNYKIAFLPPEFTDYIIVHELCHLGEFNHSRQFWNLVEKTIPNYLNLRKELRKNPLKFY